jgi:hypothetical protein
VRLEGLGQVTNPVTSSGIRRGILLSEGSQASPSRSSDKGSVEVKT